MACGFQPGSAGSGTFAAAKSCRRGGSLPPLATEFWRSLGRNGVIGRMRENLSLVLGTGDRGPGTGGPVFDEARSGIERARCADPNRLICRQAARCQSREKRRPWFSAGHIERVTWDCSWSPVPAPRGMRLA